MRIRILPIMLLLIVAALSNRSAAAGMEEHWPRVDASLSAPGRILDQYHAGVHELMAIVEFATPEPANREEVCAAMDALGELHAVEAIDLLIEKRGMKRSASIDPPDDPPVLLGKGAEAYPALPALLKIGLPPVEPLLVALAKYDGESRPVLLSMAILNILGDASQGYIETVKETASSEAVRRGAERYLNPPRYPGK